MIGKYLARQKAKKITKAIINQDVWGIVKAAGVPDDVLLTDLEGVLSVRLYELAKELK